MNEYIGKDAMIILKTDVFLCYDFNRRLQIKII